MTYKSPNPAGPNAVVGSAPIALSNLIPSLKPAKTSAAFRLSPPILFLRPSTNPHARATVFLKAPHSSAPSGSSAGVSTKELVDSLSATLSAIALSWHATSAVVITPLATSGAIVGPVITTSELDLFAFSSLFDIALEIIPEPPSSSGAKPFAKSISKCEGRKCGIN